jgi:elongation factor Ts
MSKVSVEEIKRLRGLTGVGITDAKQALLEAGGDFDKALAAMRKKGLTKADKRAEREARAGLVGSYVHDGRIGVIVEVNCETDFVAKTDEFKELVKDIAMHIAAAAPEFVSADDIPAEVRKAAGAEFSEKAKSEGKPDNMIAQIVDGMVKKHFAEKCLLEQPFIKNPDQVIGEYVKEHVAKLGENIVVRRFSRFALGEVN